MSKFSFISEHQESILEVISTDWRPQVELVFVKEKGKNRQTEIINLEEFISVKGEKALGNKLTSKKIKKINLLDPLPYTEVIKEVEEIVPEVLPEVVEEEIIEINTEIELNITNDSEEIEYEKKDDDDESSAGQITLEL
jgi:topoisomerase-4 subunit A